MEKILLEKNFYLYQFPPRPDRPNEHFGTNIYVLLDDRQALVIDTGFKEHATAVKDDLSNSGIEVRKVIISHFHPDHILGLKALPGVEVWGSDKAPGADAAPFEGWDEFLPIHILDDSSTLAFGAFTLTFRAAPGHSPCSLYTTINDRYVHVADNLIAANDGTPSLPWAEFKDVGEHIRSLESLLDLEPATLLAGHGKIFTGKESIRAEIENRLTYLRAVRDGNGEISLEEATAKCTRPFLCYWHIQR